MYAQNLEPNLSNVPKYNFYIKLYNKYDILSNKYLFNGHENTEYLRIYDSTVIKIKNTKSIIYIEKRLDADNLFIAKKGDDIILSYGICINMDADNDTIDSFFNYLMANSQLKKYYRYNKMKIICWISVIS